MSVKQSLSHEERDALLAEVRAHLPAFLHGATTEQEDPAGDVRELLQLEEGDLERVIAVHLCLDDAVAAFGDSLREGLLHPAVGSRPLPVVSRSVRGPVDWGRTAKHRALAPGDVARFVVPEPGAAFDTPENRAVAWLLRQLTAAVDEAVAWAPKRPEAGRPDLGWRRRIERLRIQLAEAGEFRWLAAIPPGKPTAAVLRRLRRSRARFYAEVVAPAVASVLRLTDYSPASLTEALATRYFRPDGDGTLFEVAVALRLARAFGERSPRHRRTRLLVGEGRSSFARYSFDDESEVRLAYQAWPDEQTTLRRRLVERHGFKSPRDAVPDIVIIRTGREPDTVILELKASYRRASLVQGLTELLAYIADRPGLWGPDPCAWLIAPSSPAFMDEIADPRLPLWIVSADLVADAAAERFAPSAADRNPTSL